VHSTLSFGRALTFSRGLSGGGVLQESGAGTSGTRVLVVKWASLSVRAFDAAAAQPRN